jgi:hypothetical protein
MRRLRLVIACAVVLLALVRPLFAAAATEDRGIVVRVQPARIVIRELDGTRAAFVVNRRTVVTLDGRRVRLRRLRRGDVATIEHAGRLALAVSAARP